jgi:hypothetical protein
MEYFKQNQLKYIEKVLESLQNVETLSPQDKGNNLLPATDT